MSVKTVVMCAKFPRKQKIKLFQVIEEHWSIIGIQPISSPEKTPFNWRNILVISIVGVYFVSTTLFLLFDATTFRECEEAFFPWITLLVIAVGLIQQVMKTREVFQFFDIVGMFIDSGKLNLPARLRLSPQLSG